MSPRWIGSSSGGSTRTSSADPLGPSIFRMRLSAIPILAGLAFVLVTDLHAQTAGRAPDSAQVAPAAGGGTARHSIRPRKRLGQPRLPAGPMATLRRAPVAIPAGQTVFGFSGHVLEITFGWDLGSCGAPNGANTELHGDTLLVLTAVDELPCGELPVPAAYRVQVPGLPPGRYLVRFYLLKHDRSNHPSRGGHPTAEKELLID